MNSELYTIYDTIPVSEQTNYENKILIVDSRAVVERYRRRDKQLIYAIGGFGCSPMATTQPLQAFRLYDGVKLQVKRCDILGIADIEKLGRLNAERQELINEIERYSHLVTTRQSRINAKNELNFRNRIIALREREVLREYNALLAALANHDIRFIRSTVTDMLKGEVHIISPEVVSESFSMERQLDTICPRYISIKKCWLPTKSAKAKTAEPGQCAWISDSLEILDKHRLIAYEEIPLNKKQFIF